MSEATVSIAHTPLYTAHFANSEGRVEFLGCIFRDSATSDLLTATLAPAADPAVTIWAMHESAPASAALKRCKYRMLKTAEALGAKLVYETDLEPDWSDFAKLLPPPALAKVIRLVADALVVVHQAQACGTGASPHAPMPQVADAAGLLSQALASPTPDLDLIASARDRLRLLLCTVPTGNSCPL